MKFPLYTTKNKKNLSWTGSRDDKNFFPITIEENKNYNDFIELYDAYKNKIEEQSDVTLISIKDEYESARDFEKRIITRWFLFCKREKDWILLNLDLNQDLLTLPSKKS